MTEDSLMANRTMQAKALKLRSQKRRYPRRMDLDIRGPRPNTTVLGDYRERAKGLALGDCWIVLDNGMTVLESQVPVVNGHLSARSEIDIDRINQKFNKPLFVEHLNNPSQRIRIYFNSRHDRVIIQQMHYLQRVARVSEVFTSMDDAYFSLKNDIVPWKLEMAIPDQ
jgi:hypothetical protein